MVSRDFCRNIILLAVYTSSWHGMKYSYDTSVTKFIAIINYNFEFLQFSTLNLKNCMKKKDNKNTVYSSHGFNTHTAK